MFSSQSTHQKMNTFRLQPHFNLISPAINLPLIIPIKVKSNHIYRSSASSSVVNTTKRSHPVVLKPTPPKSKRFWTCVIISEQHSRMVIFGAMSVGVALFLMGFDDHKALALGPEGPLMEEFWENMRRYALYVLTVSTGAIYTLLQPLVELLKNPISAILILLIFGGGIFIVSQVVTAMVGLSDFSYDYSY